MKEEISLRDILKKHENKKILVFTKSNLHYKTKNLKVFENFVTFTDKFDNEITLTISEVAQVTELKKEVNNE